MPLNIKDDRVHSQARELAQITGESITQVVRVALADRLTAVKQSQGQLSTNAKANKLTALAKICADTLHPNSRSSSHADLYGDDGMPK